MHFPKKSTNYRNNNIITTTVHLVTFYFKRQWNFTNNFNATVGFATV